MDITQQQNTAMQAYEDRKAVQAELDTALSGLKEQQAGVKALIGQHKAKQAELSNDVEALKETLSDLQEQLETATDLITAKELSKQVEETTADLKLSNSVYSATIAKQKIEMAELLEPYCNAINELDSVYKKFDKLFVRTASFQTMKEDYNFLVGYQNLANNIKKHAGNVLVRYELMEPAKYTYRYNGKRINFSRDYSTEMHIFQNAMLSLERSLSLQA